MTNGIKKYLIVITGPTAIGKTSLSIQLAQYLNTEIISADSRQFYRELRIGTAFPDEEDLKKVKHHFLGMLSVKDYYNVSKYENETLNLLNELFQKYNKVILTGGSGLYIDAVCKGIDYLPDPDESIRENLKNILKENGIDKLREMLNELDDDYYQKVDLNNPNRIIRALEVCIQTGKKYSEHRKNQRKERDFEIIKIGLKRPINELYEVINARVDKMIESGLIDEAKTLYKYKDLNALNTVGYKELFEYFEGKTELEKAIEKIKTNSRRYAKRQMTWFKKDEEIKWFSPFDYELIIKFLSTPA